ncbi:MAG TPA: hypothetical protein VF743_02960 [Acidimicrobiales bacterium]
MPAPWPLRFGAFFAPFHPVGQSVPVLAHDADLARIGDVTGLRLDDASLRPLR